MSFAEAKLNEFDVLNAVKHITGDPEGLHSMVAAA